MNKSLITIAFPLVLLAAALAPAQEMHHDGVSTSPYQAPASITPSIGQSELEQVQTLYGTWDAQTKLGVLTDVFMPFAFNTMVLGEELLNGKQITSSIFYVVNGELRVDHYCDLLNQPRYTAVPAIDPAMLDFEFRSADNIDTHPAHFHNTKWKLVDSDHMIQDWFILGGQKPVTQVHMEFVKRAEGAPVPAPTAMVK